MLFNSYIFILLFLPISIIGYFFINKTGKYVISDLFLVCMSLWFYGYYNPIYLLVIGISVIGNYLLSKTILKVVDNRLKKLTMFVGILLNALSIFYFKYYDFFIDNINKAFSTSFELQHVLLPLGISFFTFQQISYLVDSYRGQTADYKFIEYALFVVFFPQLIAGPIVLHKEMIPQFRNNQNRKVSSYNLAQGLYRFAIGLFKKVIVADTFSRAVVWGFADIRSLSSMEAIIVSLCYTLQLYFDFSGYCDMAVGIGNMFNIELPQNFNSPYKAISIVDFWNRWHMSLTRFLREYVYFPLGGSKKGTVRTYVNIMVVFLVSGIWHGANWTFIVWGILHGALNCVTRACNKLWNKLNIVFQWFITFTLVNVLWIIFRADSILDAKIFIARMIELNDFSLHENLISAFKLPEFAFIERYNIVQACMGYVQNIWMWIFLGGALFAVLNIKNIFEIKFRNSMWQGTITVIFMVWSIMSLAGVSEFLYFGF